MGIYRGYIGVYRDTQGLHLGVYRLRKRDSTFGSCQESGIKEIL